MAKLESAHFFKVQSGKLIVWGAFNNYVDRILNVDKDRHFSTPSPHLVHVVIECPLIDNELKVFIPWSVFFSFFLCDHEKEIAIAIYSARARGILNNYCGFCLQTN